MFPTEIVDTFHRNRLIALACKGLKSRHVGIVLHPGIGKFEEGLSSTENLGARYQAALAYEATPGERQEIQMLQLHRKIMLAYSKLITRVYYKEMDEDSFVQVIQDHLDALRDADSNAVIFNEPGRCMFCMPGGTGSHLVTYEFAKESDGTYSFLVYNKGEGLEYSPFHGDAKLLKRGVIAQRTRVQIKGLGFEALKNPDFLKSLVKKSCDERAQTRELYNLIRQHLIENNHGTVRIPDDEKKLRAPLRSDIERKRINGVLLKDPDYHRIQTWGSCSESNVQTPERFIISPILRKKIKLLEIQLAVKALGESYLEKNPLLHAQVLCKTVSLKRQIHSSSFTHI